MMFNQTLRSILASGMLAFIAALGSPAAGQDGLPIGTAAFFNLRECPSGWGPLAEADGRLVASLTPGGGNGAQVVLKPLGDKEDRTHTHDLSGSFTTTKVEFILIDGCCNDSLGKSDTYSFSGSTDPASSGLPYVQYLMCIKDTPATGQAKAPSGLLLYSQGFGCPTGFKRNPALQGRFMIGVPEYGRAGLSFGGAVLLSGQQNYHIHGVNGTAKMRGLDIAGGSGCCAHGYAGSDDVSVSGATEPPKPRGANSEAVDLPYIELLQCEAM